MRGIRTHEPTHLDEVTAVNRDGALWVRFNQTGDWTANSCKVVAGDFDGDGRNDVAFSHSERPGHTLQAPDFDLDGDVDLLVGGMIQSQHRGLRLMLNGGRGASWTESVIQTDGSYSAEIGDFDNDSDLDIVGIRNWNSAPHVDLPQ
jgi:hypothetical protein